MNYRSDHGGVVKDAFFDIQIGTRAAAPRGPWPRRVRLSTTNKSAKTLIPLLSPCCYVHPPLHQALRFLPAQHKGECQPGGNSFSK